MKIKSFGFVKKASRSVWLLLTIVLSFFCSCKPSIPKVPSSFATCQIPVYYTFQNCHNPTSSQNSLAYNWTLTTYYYDGSQRVFLKSVSGSSNQTNPSPNFTIAATIPNDGRFAWDADLYIESTQCSICTDMGNCFPSQNGSTWHGGIPVYSAVLGKRITPPGTTVVAAVGLTTDLYGPTLNCGKCTLQ
jgi:hypothetical protein